MECGAILCNCFPEILLPKHVDLTIFTFRVYGINAPLPPTFHPIPLYPPGIHKRDLQNLL